MHHALAPAFDNGTSLGHIIQEAQLAKYTKPDELRRLIEGGCHHFGWVAGDTIGAQHAKLCRTYRDYFSGLNNVLNDVHNLTDRRIDRVVSWCCSFDFALPFSALSTAGLAEVTHVPHRVRRSRLPPSNSRLAEVTHVPHRVRRSRLPPSDSRQSLWQATYLHPEPPIGAKQKQ